MQNTSDRRHIYRIIDANLNRAKEGLRVCEEVTRFILDNRRLTAGLKKARHAATKITGSISTGVNLHQSRDSSCDIGRKIYINELERGCWEDIFYANIQRAKESIRVLEEFSKLIDRKAAVKFKKLRYDIYGIEKESAKTIR